VVVTRRLAQESTIFMQITRNHMAAGRHKVDFPNIEPR
jgi:hypothetical protein